MKPLGRPLVLVTLVATSAAVTCTANGTALAAASGTALAAASGRVAAADVAGSVRDLAERAIDQITLEQELVEQVGDTADTTRLAAIGGRLRTVDADGVQVLDRLDQLDVALTQAIRITLGPLPTADDPTSFAADLPRSVVYEAAVADLRRISATPDAVTNAPASPHGPSFGLLAVAALALLALGTAALGNSLRRRPPADDTDPGAWSDRLTGLGNRRRLDADLVRRDRADRPTAAIVVDVDALDRIEVELGAAVSDEVVRRVGDTLSHQVREGDVVYRFDGGSFCVLLPDATEGDAHDVAERIVRAVHDVGLPDGHSVSVTVGVAGADHGDATGAVQRADDALAAARAHGRNGASAPS